MTTAQTHATSEQEVAQLIIQALRLELRPEDIRPEEPLFRDGWGSTRSRAGTRARDLARLRLRPEIR
jgi:hypothetical protein